MSERRDFLDTTMPRQIKAETAMHNGDVQPRLAMWSHNDPVTLFGAWFSASGWSEVSGIFDRLGEAFENCESYEIELVAADASDDLASTVTATAFRSRQRAEDRRMRPEYVSSVA